MIDRMPKIVGVTWPGHARFRKNYLCARSAFPVQSFTPNLKSLAQVAFEILRSKCIGVKSLTFQGHVTSSVTWPFDSPYAIFYWWFFGTKPLSLTVSEIFNVKCNAIVVAWRDLDTTSRQRSRSFILVPIDLSYTISYRLSNLNSNFCSRTHRLATTHNVTDDDRRRRTQRCTNIATVSTVG